MAVRLRTRGTWLAAAVMLGQNWACGAPAAGDLVVAPNGSDRAAGTQAAPFATLARARDAVRELRRQRAKGSLTVLVRGGVYRLDGPIEFTPEDSGTPEGRTVYAAWPGERPVLSGGRVIEGFKAGGDGVWRAGVGEFRFEQLYVDGRRAVRARTPNALYLYARGQAPGAGPRRERKGVGPDAIGRRAFRAFPQDLGPLRGLSAEQLRRVTVVVYNSWEVSRHHLASAHLDTGLLEMTGPYFVKFFYFSRPRYYFVDCPGALDQPGEWTLAEDGTLAYMPRPGESLEKAEFVAATLPHLVVFKGESIAKRVEHIELRGLSFQHSAYVLPPEGQSSNQAASKIPAAVMLDYASDIVLHDCEVSHTGTYGAWFRDGCRGCVVQRCLFTDLGAGGVRIGSCELERAKDPAHATGGVTVDNCIIHDGGHIWKGAVGVFVAHSGENRVTHNDIAGLAYTGISLGWRWGYGDVPSKRNLVAHNHIHHLGDILADMGGIYTLGEAPGTILRGNVIHDIDGHGHSGMRGIYNDNSTSDMLIEQNLVYNVRDGGYTLGSGRGIVLRNNIFIAGRNGHCGFSLYYPDRDKHVAATLERNIFYGMPSGEIGRWFAGRYPGEFLRFERNLYFDPAGGEIQIHGKTFAEWQAAGYDAGSIIADPKFHSPERHDYRLTDDSPALGLGFEPFDTSQAGVYGDPAWVAVARSRRFPAMRATAPEPPAFTLDDGFEHSAQGAEPTDAQVHTEGKGDAIAVCTNAPAAGRHCLEIRDKPGLKYAFNPHFYYRPDHWAGRTRVSFDLRLGPGARLYHEWREYPGKPYFFSGPRLNIANRQLTLGERTLMALPEGHWVHFELQAGHGAQARDTWRLAVTLPGKPPRTFDDLPIGSPGAYKRLTWLGFVSSGDADAVYWLDNIKLRYSKPDAGK